MKKAKITQKDLTSIQNDDLNILEEIIHDENTKTSVKIQAIQAREGLVKIMKEAPKEKTAADIMAEVRNNAANDSINGVRDFKGSN